LSPLVVARVFGVHNSEIDMYIKYNVGWVCVSVVLSPMNINLGVIIY